MQSHSHAVMQSKITARPQDRKTERLQDKYPAIWADRKVLVETQYLKET
jgi:hypothetical protein